jgi:hypothetical protein
VSAGSGGPGSGAAAGPPGRRRESQIREGDRFRLLLRQNRTSLSGERGWMLPRASPRPAAKHKPGRTLPRFQGPPRALGASQPNTQPSDRAPTVFLRVFPGISLRHWLGTYDERVHSAWPGRRGLDGDPVDSVARTKVLNMTELRSGGEVVTPAWGRRRRWRALRPQRVRSRISLVAPRATHLPSRADRWRQSVSVVMRRFTMRPKPL